MYLYLILNLASLAIPLAYSFNKKMYFIKHWKAVFGSIVLIGSGFIIWDAIFTLEGVWGFNSEYHLPYKILYLPIEEWLFFICIPYASLFIHYAFEYFFPKVKISKKNTQIITIALLLSLSIVLLFNTEKIYTVVNFTLSVIILIISLFRIEKLQKFYLSFLIILIPFFIVNGVLTGSFIKEPIVWYNNTENLGIRLFTIPVEDVFYAFNLLFLNFLSIERIKSSTKDNTIKE